MTTRRAGKLGALPVTHDPRTLKLANYLIPDLGAPPAARDWTTAVQDGQWGMLGNDQFGDCVEAAAGHLQQLWTAAETGREQRVTEEQILAAYAAITGFDPADPSTDQGTDPLDALNYWRRHGICGHRIAAFVEVEVNSSDELKWAVELFGALYAAVDFPASAAHQFNTGQEWTVVPGSPIEGGHMIILTAYDDQRIEAITWGQRQAMTWDWWETYRAAGFAVLSVQWTSVDGRDPAGVDVARLRADLAALSG